MPDFRDPAFLLEHIRHTLSFYEGRCLDPSGGFFHFFKDDGTVYDRAHAPPRQQHALRVQPRDRLPAFRRPEAQERCAHGLDFLHRPTRNRRAAMHGRSTGMKAARAVQDGTNHCYGLAFVLLAHAHALMAGVNEARHGPRATFALMETHFWEPAHGLYADEASAEWQLGPTAARTPTCTPAKR